MKNLQYLHLLVFGISTIVFRRKKSVIATIILTDRCNLSCRHCAVNNHECFMEPYETVRREMLSLYREGNRILFFCGGETFLWKDGEKTIVDLVAEAKRIGFYLVNVVTNGTMGVGVPGADVIFLSIDGLRDRHDLIRGKTFDAILGNAGASEGANVCVYMAVNALNWTDVEPLAELVKREPSLRSISFNFHTPYPGTEELSLSRERKEAVVRTVERLIDGGYPVFNLKSALRRYLSGKWTRPSSQCLVSEKGMRYVCGRCVEIPGLCDECGYLFAVEFSLIFHGNLRTIFEMLRTWRRFSTC